LILYNWLEIKGDGKRSLSRRIHGRDSSFSIACFYYLAGSPRTTGATSAANTSIVWAIFL